MPDNRSKRKAKVISFVTIEDDRASNLLSLINLAKKLKLEGFESVVWQDSPWVITGGRLVNQTGKHNTQATIDFALPPKLGDESLKNEWADVAKALFVLRFHRKNQAIPNQRNFITAIGYIYYAANQINQSFFQLTPEVLDNACKIISKHYADSTAYNLHKAVGEFAAHCDSNALCHNYLDYKFSRMKRPDSTGGVGHKRLDNPEAADSTKDEKMVDPLIYQVIGKLYQNVPKNHKYRLYILLLSLLILTGRRLSEVSLLPFQEINEDDKGNFYINYFPRKSSLGDTLTPLERLFLPTDIAPIVKEIIEEAIDLSETPRAVAKQMQEKGSADLRFLEKISNSKRFYTKDFAKLGLSSELLGKSGWIRKNGLAQEEVKNNSKVFYTDKEALKQYCSKYFEPISIEAIHIDQQGKKYFLADLLFVRELGLSSGAYAHWLSTSCSHSMIATFLRYFPNLSKEYANEYTEVDFTSHKFRHTMNTLLDEGGLSDLLQTEWFGRSNPRDTKVYQHTSPEKKALMLREDIKNGTIGGKLAEQIKVIPINHQDAVLKARIKAVHDVGTGLCIHNFSQMPCERHLQCSADCKDYVWVKDDSKRIEEVKRLFALTTIAQETVENQAKSKKPKKSSDWTLHNEKKLQTLGKQLSDYGVENFDPSQYLKETSNV
ncbi:integrase [Psychrobacter okhotskensis]|uniref:integrase n=1 Tax=Psychrobacter okhotskensis TaxID=212403 RepID=UPI0019181527|nr:integrase [Psychrobacter okhotskensis]